MKADNGKSGQKRSKAGHDTGTAEATGKLWRKRLLPLLVCLALAPAPVVMAANSGGQDNVPGTGDYGNDTPSGNAVTIDSDVTGNVYGSYLDSGTTTGNTVTMTGGTVRRSLKGGYTVSGDAENNTVMMSGGSVNALRGGEALTGNAIGNQVIFTGTTTISTTVAGGYAGTGDAIGNTVQINGTILRSSTINNIYGGYVETEGNAENNRIVMDDGHVAQNVRGANVKTGDATGNSVTMNDSEANYAQGAYVTTGNATGNHVIMENSTVTSYASGAYIANAQNTGATDNSVTMNNSIANFAQGANVGTGNATGNHVIVENNSEVKYTALGATVTTGDAASNSLTINNAKANFAQGAYVGTGNATGNHVTVENDSKVNGSVQGASVGTGDAADNIAVMSNSEANFAQGAYVTKGNATGNHITVENDSKVNGSVQGAYVETGDATDNIAVMSNSEANFAQGANITTAENTGATNNRIIVENSKVTGSVQGAYVGTGDATGNLATMSNTEANFAQGANVGTGNATGNHITVENGSNVTVSVQGAYVGTGDATGNSATVSGTAQVGASVYGGYVDSSGTASGNSATIAGNTAVNGDIYGGYVNNVYGTATEGDATGNTVTLATGAGANLLNSTVYGGGSNVAGADVRTGNTLNVDTGHVEVKNIANFQTVNLNVNTSTVPTAGNAVLTLNNATGTDLSGTQVNIGGGINGGQRLADGTIVTFIENTNGLTTDATTLSGTATLKQGVSLTYDLTLQANAAGNAIEGRINNTALNPATGVFTNGRLATVGFFNEGTDFALDTGMTKAMETIRAQGYGAYGAIRGSDIRHDLDKGGDASVSGTHWLLGLAGKLNTAKDYDLIGSIYAEAGWGNIDSDNSFASGHGDTRYYGIGLIGRYQQNEGTMKGAYAQINAKVGRASTDLESNLYDANGNRGEYDKDATYYGAGIGVGYLWEIAQAYTLDLSAKYQWMHLEGYDTRIANDPYKFDDIDSHRTRVGARLNYTENKQYTPYIGVAWEHEFSGSARGSVYGYSLEDNSLKGDTGVAEIGVTFSPTADSAWKIDANVQGYVGQREGVAGNLAVNYMF